MLGLRGWTGGHWFKHYGVFSELVLDMSYCFLKVHLLSLENLLVSIVPNFIQDKSHI